MSHKPDREVTKKQGSKAQRLGMQAKPGLTFKDSVPCFKKFWHFHCHDVTPS
jgi:hypothetical protein